MRIGILGPLDVRDAASRPVEVGGARLRTLLIRLAVDPGRTVPAERLIDDLWGDSPPAAANNALQALVSRLRGAGGRDLVESRPGGYRLTVDPGEVDAVAFERLTAEARAQAGVERAETLRRALALWRGPALADVAGAAFATAPIARLEEMRLAATEDRIEADLDLGDGAGLVPELEELTTLHPLRERLSGQYMRALYAAGRQAEALTVYEETRRTLADQLGVDPSPALAAVHVAILRGESGPEPQPAAEPPRTNLPAQLTSFVGREEEIERVGELLGAARLVTLTGPGGTGKTRLAIEAASRFSPTLPDGVWFVPLAPIRGAVDVPQAVLTAIGIPETLRLLEAREILRPLDRLADVLAAKRLILVLDNCEHLIDAVAGLADRLLAAAPGVRILATSREPLGITGESLCPVPSLSLPPDGAEAESAQPYEAVRLFTDRAAAVRPGFALDADTTGSVVRICRALDGAPLAIELAAARLRALTPTQVADRLDDRFRLLTVGSRTALPRHQTLRAVVDWSWDLLDDVERRVLRRLSVFNGGATPDSAEAVLEEDVIDVIASLVDKSLVLAEGNTEVRYRLQETVRAYAAERLSEAGEEKQLRGAHAAYFLDLAERAEPELRGRSQLLWADRLTAEHDNCTAALRHALDIHDVPTAVRFVGALAWFWILRDYEAEAGEWAVAAWRLTDGQPPEGAEDAYVICGFTAAMVEEMTREGGPRPDGLRDAMRRAVARLPEDTTHPALALCRPLADVFSGDIGGALRQLDEMMDHPDPWARAARHTFIAFLTLNEGDLGQAGSAAAAGYAGFRELGDRWGMGITLICLAEMKMACNRPAEAIDAIEEARRYASEGISPEQGTLLMMVLGRARDLAGDVEAARADMERGARAAERIGEHGEAANGWVWLSEFARREGDLATARTHLEHARSFVEGRTARVDLGPSSAFVFSKLGCLTEQEGDLTAAEHWHSKAMSSIGRFGLLPVNNVIALAVEGLAALAAARGDHTRAAELLGGAHTVRGYDLPWNIELSRTTEACVAAVGRAAFDAAYARGLRMTRDEALALTP